MTTAANPPLLERDDELAALSDALDAARAGRGGVVLLEAPAGQGKTTLLRMCRARAAEAGIGVLSATGSELERDFAFGMVRQLFEPRLHTASAVERERLLSGAAAFSASIFGTEELPTAADPSHARLHGLYWLLANLSESGPLMLAVDDAHWADPPSLRFLAIAARRIEDLPVALVVASRPGEPGADRDLLDHIATAPAATVLQPPNLSVDAVAGVVAEALGVTPDGDFAAACAECTAGNPLFVRELCRALVGGSFTGTAEEAPLVRSLVPETVARLVSARLRRLPAEAVAVARAVAVLGDRVPRAAVVDLARSTGADVDGAHAALAAAGLLEAAELRFVHPVVREAVYGELGAGDRSTMHREAAALLAGGGAGDDEVALHLLAAEPSDDPWAAAVLASAGRRALSEGAPEVATRLLARACEEAPPAPALLLDLGIARARSGVGDAVDALERARTCGDPIVAARAAQTEATVLVMLGRGPRAPAVIRAQIDDVRPVAPAVAGELEDAFLDSLPYDDGHIEEYRRLIADETSQRPTRLAHLAWDRAAGGARAEEVRGIADRALADGTVADLIGSERFAPLYLAAALQLIDDDQRAAQVLRDADRVARRSGSGLAAASITWMSGQWQREFGDLRRSEADGRRGLEILEFGPQAGARVMSHVTLAAALVDQGRIAEAEVVAAQLPRHEGMTLRSIGLHALWSRIRFEQGRYVEALAEYEEHMRIEALRGRVVDLREPRVLRARILTALGRRDDAREVASAEVTLAVRRGVASAEGEARLALAGALGAGEAIAEHARAVEAARRSPARHLLARALFAQGRALRRANQRVAARTPLREARALADRCGAASLAEASHEELIVAGGRPRRLALDGVDALTAAERRVAELAAQGRRNREIAEELFVTMKTVEVHLSHVYRKLGITSRSQLPSLVGTAADAAR